MPPTRSALPWREPRRKASADPLSSYFWFSLAARQDFKEAAARANTMSHYLTPEQLAEAERRLAQWNRSGPRPAFLL
jgi:hypothetical protein